MIPLREDLSRFLGLAFPGAPVEEISGDASHRRFYRIRLGGGATAVVMDYGSPFEGETDDMRLSRIFATALLPVARVLRVEPPAGCLVLEDLGGRTLEATIHELRRSGLPAGAIENRLVELYEGAVDLAVAVAVRGSSALSRSDRRSGPALDAARFRFEMDFFVEHYVQGLRGVVAPPPGLAPALHALADAAANSSPHVFCHRDFHSRNLMIREDGSLAMVDIQDARWGPDAYDLASLLRDAYIDLPETLVDTMIARYRSSLRDPRAADGFRDRFDLVSAQRMVKALGTFAYQAVALGKRRYLAAIPRTLERLNRLPGDLRHWIEAGDALRGAGLLEPLSGDDL